jgi:hypothetical protein
MKNLFNQIAVTTICFGIGGLMAVVYLIGLGEF